MALRTAARSGHMLDLPGVAQHAPDLSARAPVVVILLLAVPSTEPSDGSLADGIVEEITHATACRGQVRAIARHSAFQVPAGTKPATDTARRLSADCFLDGKARRAMRDGKGAADLGRGVPAVPARLPRPARDHRAAPALAYRGLADLILHDHGATPPEVLAGALDLAAQAVSLAPAL